MQQSKRLMVVLTPASVSEPAVTDRSPVARQTAALSEFDWQVRSFENGIPRILLANGDGFSRM